MNGHDLDPDKVSITSPSKLFAYEKMSREIGECQDIDLLKNLLRCYIKLYFKQQETIAVIGIPDGNP